MTAREIVGKVIRTDPVTGEQCLYSYSSEISTILLTLKKELLKKLAPKKDLENEQITDGDINQDIIDGYNQARAEDIKVIEEYFA